MDYGYNTCRSCQKPDLEVFLDLGRTPLANSLLTRERLDQAEPFYPLEVAFCHNCGLVQILETVPPETIFCQGYPYYSSFSQEQLQYAKRNVEDLINSRNLNENSFVVEVGSNDGYLLKNYVAINIPCLGIDPAEGPAQKAQAAGIPTLCRFFDRNLAQSLASAGRKADIIHLNNTLAHIAGIHELIEGVGVLLKEEGLAVIQVPYVKDLIDHLEFDTIYHEHLCYFSGTALDFLFRRHSLFLNKVQRLKIHGGSLRLYIAKQEAVDSSVEDLMANEISLGIDHFDFYRNFALKVEKLKYSLNNLLYNLKEKNKRIVVYGASAKGCTLINYCGIDKDIIDYCVDRNPNKQGKYLPGKHIPIYNPEKLLSDLPDYVLLLTWNFAEEILQQQSAYRNKGGHFIIPIPEIEII